MSSPRRSPTWERRFRAASAVCSAGVIAIGLLALVGWAFDITLFKSVLPSFTTMKANTALLFVGLGVGLWLARSRAPGAMRARRIVGLVVALGAAVTLAEYLLEVDLGIDELLFEDPGIVHPGRMAPATGLIFLLLGLALLLQAGPLPSVVSRTAALLAAISALIALLGYLYGAPSLYAIPIYKSVALHTAVAFLLAACAVLLARPDAGIARLLADDSAAGRLLRRLVPAIVLAPVLIGWVQLLGQSAGYYDARFGVALMTLSTVVSLTFFSSIIAASLHRSEVRRLEIEAARQRLLEDMQLARTRLEADVEAMTGLNRIASLFLPQSAPLQSVLAEVVAAAVAISEADFGNIQILDPRSNEHVEQSPIFQNGPALEIQRSAGVRAVQATPLLTRSGEPVGILSTHYTRPHRPDDRALRLLDLLARQAADIIERARSDQRLRATQEQLHLAHRVARMGTFDLDIKTGVNTWTPELEQMYGLSVGEFAGTQPAWEDLVHPDDRTRAVRSVEEAFETGAPTEAEWRVRWPDGSTHWLSGRFQVFKDEAGRPVRLTGINIEITERKRAEEQRERLLAEIHDLTRNLEARVEERTEELALARDRLDGIISLAADAIISIDNAQRITIFNRAAEEIFGWTREEVLGKPLDLLLPEHVRGVHRELVARFAREPIKARQMAERSAVFGLRKNGQEFPAEAAISKQETDGSVQFTVILRDITARKHLEEEQARTYAERAVLLREIHHRVKNNLQVISSLFYLQARRIEQETARKLLDESRGRLQSIALIHEKLYRSEQLASIDFGDYLRDLTANLTSAIGVQAPLAVVRIEAEEIFLDIDRAIPCALIVNELVSNSMKHAFPEGRSGEIRIAVTRADPELRLEVSDTGIGFPADLDFRNVTTLGLQLVVSLTKQLRGTVELVRGQGTTFRIHVPACAPARRPARSAPSSPPRPRI